jgi:hypothetical protein
MYRVAKRGFGNDVDVEGGPCNPGRPGDALESLANDRQGVFGRVEEHGSGCFDREAAQGLRATGHGHREIEREERLATLGLAPHDANGLLAPEPLDEPGLPGRTHGEVAGAHDIEGS